MDVTALERCVGDPAGYLDRHWGRAPLLFSTPDSRAFDDLASLDDLDHMVSSLALRESSLRMVKDGKPLPSATYTRPAAAKARGREAFIDPARVYERYAEGATIVLEGLHRYWAPLADLCRDLEVALGHRLQVNAYVTPPGSQGFDVHRDDHDVFVLQVSGSKHWVVYDRDDDERVLIERDLERGDSLYIPKGFPHAASTTEEASAHLTVGILTHEAMDVVREVMKLAEREPVFRERLPAGASADPDALRSVVEATVADIRAWVDKIDVDELTRRVARKVASSPQTILRGQLRQLGLLPSIEATTEVARRRGASMMLFDSPGTVRVLLTDRELELPGWTGPALGFIAGADRFRVADLHDRIDPESALVLVRRMVREGLLEVAG